MADKETPSATQTASSEPRLAEQETKLATNPIGTESSTTAKPDEQSVVGKAASDVSAAATGVKDSVFSMFGGGAKKEKKVEEEEENERSGSSKAKKAEEEDV